MVQPPAAIIFVNNDLSESAEAHLVRQLFINDVQTGAEFDANVAADPEYPDKLKQLNQRVMVVRTFVDRGTVSTWELADVVIFVKQGLAAVECSRMGPPTQTFKVTELYWGKLGIY